MLCHLGSQLRYKWGISIRKVVVAGIKIGLLFEKGTEVKKLLYRSCQCEKNSLIFRPFNFLCKIIKLKFIVFFYC